MKQNVKVIENKGEEVVVGCDSLKCDGCNASFFCTNKNASFKALNPNKIDLKKGEEVEIDLPQGKTLISVFFSLGLPLIMFLPGYFIGTLFTQNELILFLWSVGFIAVGFLFSFLFFRKRRKQYSPSITKIISREEN